MGKHLQLIDAEFAYDKNRLSAINTKVTCIGIPY